MTEGESVADFGNIEGLTGRCLTSRGADFGPHFDDAIRILGYRGTAHVQRTMSVDDPDSTRNCLRDDAGPNRSFDGADRRDCF